MNEIDNRLDISEMTSEIEMLKAECYLPNFKPPENVADAIASVTDMRLMRNLTCSQLYEYAVVLSAYAIYLNIQENRFNAFAGWCDRNIDYIVGKHLDQTPYSFYTEKRTYIVSNEPNAVELDKKKNAALTQSEYIKFLSQKIIYLSDRVKDMAQAKSKEQRHVA